MCLVAKAQDRMSKKRNKNKQEKHFQGGYIRASRLQCDLLLELAKAAKGEGNKLKVHQTRIFAALLIKKGSPNQNFSTDWLINGDEPKRRMTKGQQKTALDRLKEIKEGFELETDEKSKWDVKIPSKVLFQMARGKILALRAVLLILYFSRRMTQKKPYKGLKKGECYARINYKEVSELLGYSRSRICECMKWLRKNLLLFVVSMKKQNENRYGMCFVDGAQIGTKRRAFEYTNEKKKKGREPTPEIKNPFKGKAREDFERTIARAAIMKQFQTT